ncbi:MAG TPA: chemotaxis protein CheD [Sedimentisphaerales bacterium]|nr:chemotaxis protein CheD [Sedimentisphaerales bacterium]
MKKIIDVNTGEVKLGGRKTILRSLAIGSCIVIAAYDSKHRVGAMAHIMLPGGSPKETPDRTKYAADAIDELIRKMTRAGAKKDDIEVCLVGGGNVLKKKDDSICRDNIESTTRLLSEKQIPVRNSVLGGTERKGVFLDVETGSISYTEGDGREKPLWKPPAAKH